VYVFCPLSVFYFLTIILLLPNWRILCSIQNFLSKPYTSYEKWTPSPHPTRRQFSLSRPNFTTMIVPPSSTLLCESVLSFNSLHISPGISPIRFILSRPTWLVLIYAVSVSSAGHTTLFECKLIRRFSVPSRPIASHQLHCGAAICLEAT